MLAEIEGFVNWLRRRNAEAWNCPVAGRPVPCKGM